jgi:hypothetical protein
VGWRIMITSKALGIWQQLKCGGLVEPTTLARMGQAIAANVLNLIIVVTLLLRQRSHPDLRSRLPSGHRPFPLRFRRTPSLKTKLYCLKRSV